MQFKLPMKKHLYLPVVIVFLFIISCSKHAQNHKITDPLVAHIDSTIKPGTDFFLFANGKWFKENPIPANEQNNGLWQLIQDTINAQIYHICKSSASAVNASLGSNKQMIGDFFYSGMDSITLNKNKLSDLRDAFTRIEKMKSISEMASVVAYLHAVGGNPLFGFGVYQDDRLSNKNALYFVQDGLSLPDRSYYFDKDARAIDVRKKFVMHLENMFVIMGYNQQKAKVSTERLMKLQTEMAKASRKREDTRDPLKNYHKLTLPQLQLLAPEFNWLLFMQSAGIQHPDSVIIGQPEYLKALNYFLTSYTLNDWKDYLKYGLLHSLSPYVDDKTYAENFNFYRKVLRGIKEPKPRWKRVVEMTDNSLGELIGKVYVTDYLPAGTKEKLLEIGHAIKDVYAERIKKLDWMSASTKEKALNKLNSIIMKVGYPDKWKDLSSLIICRTSYVQNVMNANAWEFNYMVSKYGKPVDRTEWSMEPQTYNAYYNPSNNEIVVPGCNIIVPGYERKLADDALLYAIIGGSTFGHEITHGFDDQGSKYDASGNLHNWWMPADSMRFCEKTKRIVRQFNQYIVVDSLHINGDLTQGENIADLGGITMGYEAFRKTSQYKTHQKIAGLTPDQRFFLGYALAWMVNERPEALANQVRSNEHAPAKYRVIGPLTDMESFYTTFNIKKGDPMYRPDSTRVIIW